MGNVEKEREILTSVASYGRQLGHINGALNVVISLVVSQAVASRLGPDEQRALNVFSRMFKELAEAKGEHVAPTEKDLGTFLGDVRDLENQDPEAYEKMNRRLRGFAQSEQSG